jgi:ABC-type multidrug transport system fused ATPase/permease subunit
VIISHRLSTVQSADRILILNQGQLVEQGSHHALLLLSDAYAALYNRYFRHQSANYQPGTGFVPLRDA